VNKDGTTVICKEVKVGVPGPKFFNPEFGVPQNNKDSTSLVSITRDVSDG